jgi:hypothetical protein
MERKGGVNRLYLAALRLSLKRGRCGRDDTTPVYYGRVHWCITGRGTASPGAFTSEEAARRDVER